MQDAGEIDIAIVGGGPAGLVAAIYAGRARRRTVLWEHGALGGQVALSGRIENYPGFPDGIDGPDLVQAMHRQAEHWGAQTRSEAVTALHRDGAAFRIVTQSGEHRARAVIVTAGAEAVRLDVPGEAELTGRGVSYCATCDAPFFRDQHVAMVGGGDAAIDEALFAARFARRVTVIHRRGELRAERVLQERAFAEPKIAFRWHSVVERIAGGTVDGHEAVTAVVLRDVRSGERSTLPVDGVFVFIGHRPASHLLAGLVPLDRGGHARVTLWMETEVPGLFAAGDVRADAARQLVSAAGDGATAAIRADRYLNDLDAHRSS